MTVIGKKERNSTPVLKPKVQNPNFQNEIWPDFNVNDLDLPFLLPCRSDI